jgi:hypothetical protein
MPRTTSYYGRKLGAIVTERREGTVSEVSIGSVRRFTASGQAKGAGLLPKVILAGHDGRQVAELLRQLLFESASRDDFDNALSLVLACSGFSPIDDANAV